MQKCRAFCLSVRFYGKSNETFDASRRRASVAISPLVGVSVEGGVSMTEDIVVRSGCFGESFVVKFAAHRRANRRNASPKRPQARKKRCVAPNDVWAFTHGH